MSATSRKCDAFYRAPSGGLRSPGRYVRSAQLAEIVGEIVMSDSDTRVFFSETRIVVDSS